MSNLTERKSLNFQRNPALEFRRIKIIKILLNVYAWTVCENLYINIASVNIQTMPSDFECFPFGQIYIYRCADVLLITLTSGLRNSSSWPCPHQPITLEVMTSTVHFRLRVGNDRAGDEILVQNEVRREEGRRAGRAAFKQKTGIYK